jgi:hypothetical protein
MYQPRVMEDDDDDDDDDDDCGAIGGMRICRGKHNTWPDMDSNSDGRGEKPATNSLSYGTAKLMISQL